MERNTRILFLLQTSVFLWLLVLVFMIIVWAWTLFYPSESMEWNGPGINLKEF